MSKIRFVGMLTSAAKRAHIVDKIHIRQGYLEVENVSVFSHSVAVHGLGQRHCPVLDRPPDSKLCGSLAVFVRHCDYLFVFEDFSSSERSVSFNENTVLLTESKISCNEKSLPVRRQRGSQNSACEFCMFLGRCFYLTPCGTCCLRHSILRYSNIIYSDCQSLSKKQM